MSETFDYEGFVVSEIEPGFRHLEFNRPKNLNAFKEQNWRDYQEILERLDKEPETNLILISSRVEKSFCSGLDLKESMKIMTEMAPLSDKEKYDTLHKHIIEFQHAIATPARISTPTICLMHGICIGLGLDIATACSIRVTTENVKMSIREIKIGIIADMGSIHRFPNLIGNKSKLYQYALTGQFFGAKDAMAIGMVSDVFPDYKSGLDHCIELGKDINTNPQWAIKGSKENIQFMVDGNSVKDGLAKVAVTNAIHMNGLESKF